jgi:NADPH:quinone reductase-like Zn-dependent oxidoreductase
MKASVYTKYGPPAVLTITTIEKPAPKNKEVLVAVKATTVNRTDCAMLRAKPFIMRFMTGLFKPKNPVLGTEFAGIIETVGKDVQSFKPGDNVFGFTDQGVSSHAQYLVLAADKNITTIPENITYQQAAASTEGAHYAYNMIKKAKLKPGQKVLVNGASGGIGSAAVQLLKHFGATITAVCSTKNIELVKSLGADSVIDYTSTDFTKEDQQYDFVFDTVGKSSFGKCKPVLQRNGVYISSELGWMCENIFFAIFTPLFSKKKVIFPIPTDIKGSVLLVKELMEQGKFKAVIDREYPFEKIAEAFSYVETGQKTGNVVISMDDTD